MSSMEVDNSPDSTADNLLRTVDNIYNASYKEKIDEGVDEKRAKRYSKQQAVLKIDEFFRSLLKRPLDEDEYEEDGMQDYLFNNGKMTTLKKAIKKEKSKTNYDVEVVEILLHALNEVATNKIYRSMYKKKPVSIGMFGGKKTRKTNRSRRRSKKTRTKFR